MRDLVNVLILSALIARAAAATWYVDGAVAASGDGRSWATAWKGVESIAGVHGGDTVFISGGATSQRYTASAWTPPSGVAGNPIRYRVGQDAGHDGMVVFDGGGAESWIHANSGDPTADYRPCDHIVVDGEVRGANHITVRNYALTIYADLGFTAEVTFRCITAIPRLRAYGSNGVTYERLVLGPDNGADACITGLGSGTGYTSNAIRDCTFYAAYQHDVNAQGGDGDDVIQNVTAVTISSCRFIGVYTPTYRGSQHQDGIQCASWVRVEGCYFQNMANYAFYGEFFGDGGHLRILDNVFDYSDPALTAQPSCAIAIGSSSPGVALSDIVVASNTVRGGGRGISLGGGHPDTAVTGSYVVDNLVYGSSFELISSSPGGVPRFTGSGITSIGNKQQNGATVSVAMNNAGPLPDAMPVAFVDAAGSDFHLAAGDLGARDQGSDWPASLRATDADGVHRPQGAAWDIGAYEYVVTTTGTTTGGTGTTAGSGGGTTAGSDGPHGHGRGCGFGGGASAIAVAIACGASLRRRASPMRTRR